MSRVAFSLGFSSMEPKRRALRPIAPHACHDDTRRLPVIPDENCFRKGLVEFHKGQARISCREFPSHQMIKLAHSEVVAADSPHNFSKVVKR
jgi:hypothetical protein